ncbi:unnamed protein product [Acidithrix sp. C25]|nr:unnamed protein product [Acidithrix sp. C25]
MQAIQAGLGIFLVIGMTLMISVTFYKVIERTIYGSEEGSRI